VAKIVFWLGSALETWDPLTALDTGIGGAETAAIHMTAQLALLGHDVIVYADCPSQFIAAKDDGQFSTTKYVEWCNYKEFNPGEVEGDLFISSRKPKARGYLQPKCRRAWLWMHDLHCGADWDNRIETDYDKVLCLSKWARDMLLDFYPGVDPSKVVQTSNGIDTRLFEGGREITENMAAGAARKPRFREIDADDAGKFPNRQVTWSSSPDRGLERLLDMWPKIRDIDSNSVLDVYGGFETWRRLADLRGSSGDLARITLLKDRLAAMANQGVVFHGRCGQQEVADSYMQSQLWLYPTTFEEVSCITAMEAQAAGCKIVATRCGALPETVPGAWFVDPPVSGKDYEERFLEAVRQALIDDSVVVGGSRSWAEVAKEWDSWIGRAPW
jgi:glycosyltransferase involved in cell wall biosynthesis